MPRHKSLEKPRKDYIKGKTPLPQSEEAERRVLGSVLRVPKGTMEALDAIGLMPSHFFNGIHEMLYGEMREMWLAGIPIDDGLLIQRLLDNHKFNLLPNAAFIGELSLTVSGAVDACMYGQILIDKKRLRDAAILCAEFQDRLHTEQDNPEIMEELQRRVFSIGSWAGAAITSECVTDKAKRQVIDKSSRFALGGDDEETILQTGIAKWDRNIGGLSQGLLYVIAAMSKIGKTAFAEQVMGNLMDAGHGVLIFQKDMSPRMMLERMACRKLGFVFQDYNLGRLSSDQYGKIASAVQSFDSKKLRIYSPERMTATEVRAIMRREIRESKVSAVIMDVFQRMDVEEGENTTEELTRASKAIRDATNQYGLPTVLLAHLNENDKPTERPHSSQVKYCRQLLSDCDVLTLMWSPEDPKDCYTRETKKHKRQHVKMSVERSRVGQVSDFNLYFDRPHMKFFNERGTEFEA